MGEAVLLMNQGQGFIYAWPAGPIAYAVGIMKHDLSVYWVLQC